MGFVEKIYFKLSIICYRICAILKIIFCSLFNKNRVYLFGIPIHGNLGDQAILLAEEKFLHDNFKDTKIIGVESSVIIKYNKLLKKLIGNSTILITGGGFLGSLWINEEEMFKTTLKTFPNNTIIVLPQTIYFSEDEEGKRIFEESKKIYYAHKKLYICCREKYSYNFMKEKLPLCNVIIVPDMVLYLDNINENNSKSDVLFCIRQDKEKVEYNFEELNIIFKNNQINNIDSTDTVIKKNIYTLNRRKNILNKKLKQFSKYRLVVTDRLHGMIFALLANTPCLVFENKSYKVKGVYEWIKDVNYIKLCQMENMEQDVKYLLNQKEILHEKEELMKKYTPLIQLISDSIEKNEKRGK